MHTWFWDVSVAEVQTPSDVTYRLYDWQRVDDHGRSRPLHIEQALANVRFDVRDDEIRQPRRHVASVFTTTTRALSCERFMIEQVRILEGITDEIAFGEMAVWIITKGRGAVTCRGGECGFVAGDVLLIPAGVEAAAVRTDAPCEWLDVKVPVASDLTGMPRPERESAPASGGPVSLTRSGEPIDPRAGD